MNKKVLQNYIKEIEAERFRDPAKMLKLSRKLSTDAKKEHDDIARAYGEYLYLEAKYRSGDLTDMMLTSAARTLQLCRKCGLYELEAKCNNMLGIFFLNQGDNITALEYYQEAMEIAAKHRFKAMSRTLANNVGDLYMQLKQYDTALVYLEKSLKQSIELLSDAKTQEEQDTVAININICRLNMSECYYFIGKTVKALEQIEEMYPLELGEEYYGAAKDAHIVLCYAAQHRLNEVEPLIEKTIRDVQSGKERIEAVWEYINVCQALLKDDRLEQAKLVFNALRNFAEKLNFSRLWCAFHETAIMMAKKLNDVEGLLTAYENYVEAKEQWDEFQREQQVKAIKNRQILSDAIKKQRHAENEKVRLKQLSEHDALTGLYNRYVLNRICEKWCMKAKEEKSNIGVIVLDIDYFKQYNDFYGHIMGDQVLKTVGAVLTETVGEKGIAVRYGGDEFFILTHHLETEDMVEMAKCINDRMCAHEMLHEMSIVSKYVTVSQGIVNGVPEEEQSFLDVVHLADNALYKAKEKKRSYIGVKRAKGYEVLENETLVEK